MLRYNTIQQYHMVPQLCILTFYFYIVTIFFFTDLLKNAFIFLDFII